MYVYRYLMYIMYNVLHTRWRCVICTHAKYLGEDKGDKITIQVYKIVNPFTWLIRDFWF